MKRICLLALFVFSTAALFAERYQISLSQKGNDLVFILDCIKESENEFIRPVAYEKGGKRFRFNMTASESSDSHSMEFLAMVRHGGVYCVGMMADSVNHGTGYAEMTDCRSKEEAMELLYVWSAVVAHNKGNQFSMKLYPGSVFTEGLEDSARSYTFPRESGFTERIPLVHIQSKSECRHIAQPCSSLYNSPEIHYNLLNYLSLLFYGIYGNLMNYSEINLHELLQKGLSECGYVTCTPVQEQVLSTSLEGSDLYVQSQTGTGKTAAFLVSIMQEILSHAEGEKKNALILVPTRELAVQVEEEAQKVGKYTGLRFASFYGGVGYEKQVADLKKGVDIIIGTPGRVIDLTESRQMDLSRVGYLTIDEADRMFDMGFYPDLRKLIHFLPKNEGDKKARQTMLFSATLNSYVKNLAWEYTRDAKEITIEAQNITVDEIDQELIHVSSDDKMRLLLGIFQKENPESVIIFCDTKKMCEIVSKRLSINGIKNEYIIGDLPQSKRLKIMDSFKAGKVTCLVATDVAARGIDVNDLAMVVNYDLPNEAENYVHRIGRTARAGKSGKAYTFCSERDVYSLAPIERYIEKQIPSRVAVEEDFAEDKSKDVYIRLDSEEKREGRGERSRRGHVAHNAKQMDADRAQRGERNSRKQRNRRGESRKIERMNQDELNRVAAMSADERMKYYKEKYGNNAKQTAELTKKYNEKHEVSVKKTKELTKRYSEQYGSPKSGYGKKGAKSEGRGRGKSAQSRKNEVPPKKLGLLGRLKSLIGRGK